MRNPRRIKPFCELLALQWKKVPDWRFGQFMSNFLGWAWDKSNKDIFFIEDDEMEDLLLEYLKIEEAEDAE